MSNSSLEQANLRDAALKADIAVKLAKTKLYKLQWETKAGNLVPINKAQDLLDNLLISFRSKLLAMPNKLAPVACNKDMAEVEAIIRQEINSILEDMANAQLQVATASTDADYQ